MQAAGGFHFGSFELDPETRELYKDGTKLPLQDKPLDLLAVLLEQPQVTVTRDELRSRLWPDHTFVDFDHSINVAVNKLREALGDSAKAPLFIETVPRHGYRFVASVDRRQPRGPPPRNRSPWLWAAVLGLLALSVLLLYVYSEQSGNRPAGLAERPQIASLAVLPLENMSPGLDQDYLADGITAAIIAELGKIGALRVISWQSVVQFKGSQAALPEIAYLLGVDALVVGCLQRTADRIHVHAQLVAAKPERQLWANSYDGELAELLDIQQQIAWRIAHEVQVVVTPEEVARLASDRSIPPEAYGAYLKGLYDRRKYSEGGLSEAVEHLTEAIRIDPGYAAAHAALADVWSTLSWYGHVRPRVGFPRAETAARRALELDADLAQAHNSIAVVLSSYHWRPSAAERHYREAIRLNPSFALAYSWYSWSLAAQGRQDEALAQIRYAHDLGPLSLATNSIIGLRLYEARRYQEAIRQLRDTLEMNPSFVPAILFLAWAYQQTGQHAEAVESLQEASEYCQGLPACEAALASAFALAGRQHEAEAALARLLERSEEEYVSAYLIATIHLALDRRDLGFEWLERAREERSPWMSRLRIEPLFDAIRSDDRFAELLRDMG